MIEVVASKNGVPIRLTDERWAHITEEHCELAGLRSEVLETISDPVVSLKEVIVSFWQCVNWNQESLWWLCTAS